MRIFFLLLGLLGVYTIFQVIRSEYYIQVGRRLATAAVPYEQHPPSSTMRVLFVGDSTGVGTGASGPAHSLAGIFGTRFPKADITNRAVNGAKTADVITQLQNVTSTYDLIMIDIGGNDTVRFTNLDTLKADLHTVLEMAALKAPHILVTSTGNVGTVPLFPYPLRWILRDRTLAVRAVFMTEIASQTHDIRYTDLFRDHAHDPFAQDPGRYYAADSFHPSDEGYLDWFSLMMKEIEGFKGLQSF